MRVRSNTQKNNVYISYKNVGITIFTHTFVLVVFEHRDATRTFHLICVVVGLHSEGEKSSGERR